MSNELALAAVVGSFTVMIMLLLVCQRSRCIRCEACGIRVVRDATLEHKEMEDLGPSVINVGKL